jgi:hypothetical protein
MRSLTIAQACAESNIWFKVETEEQQRMFQEEFFKRGGRWDDSDIIVVTNSTYPVLCVSKRGTLYRSEGAIDGKVEQVQILWQEPSISIASLAPDVTLIATLNPSLNWQDTLALLTQLKNEELAKDFISDKCLRKLDDSQLASLASFLLEKQTGATDYACGLDFQRMESVKSFVLTAKNFHTKKTKCLEYWYKFYRKEVERVVRQAQAGLYQEELKDSPEWVGLSWERRGEEG